MRHIIIAIFSIFTLAMVACVPGTTDTKPEATKQAAIEAGGYLLNVAMIKPKLEAFRAQWAGAGEMLETRQGDYGDDFKAIEDAYLIVNGVLGDYSVDFSGRGGAKKIILDAMKMKTSVDQARAAWATARRVIKGEIEAGRIDDERIGRLMELDRTGRALSDSLASLKDIPVGSDVSPYVDLTLQLAGSLAEVVEAY